ncbi:sulfotransferase domain-containing protein [Sphingomonas sp. GCM10030256]|uniref:sulfotransferase domain-containing protein n=1 Tax=Sphingomonas sp. GCM10030256 TaxID=3273427 RepID=UPI003616476D
MAFKIRKFGRRFADAWYEIDRRCRSSRDVVVISYPKSGRTWLRFMLEQANVRLMYDHAGAKNKLALTFEEISAEVSAWQQHRIVFLFRDPRDTVVSSYFEATKRLQERYRFAGSLREFVFDRRYGLEKIARYNLHWLESLHTSEAGLSVAYEDLHSATADEIKRVIEFAVRRVPTPRKIEEAVRAGRFDNMRRVETALNGKMNERNKLGGGIQGDVESLKTRRGVVNGWTGYFNAEEQQQINDVLNGLNYFERVRLVHPFVKLQGQRTVGCLAANAGTAN